MADDRPAPTKRHELPLLDGLRGAAALMVVMTHVAYQTGTVNGGPFGAALARLDLGVALFFVLSGFLLLRPWLAAAAAGAPRPATRTYLVRRAARILPAYWLVLVVALLTTARGTSFGAGLANAGLLQVYTGQLLDGLTQTWSLCTEVAFYLLLPVLAIMLAARRGRPGRAGTRFGAGLLVAMCGTAWGWTALSAAGALPGRSSTWLPGHLDWFAAGMGVALLEAALRRGPESPLAARVAELARHPWSVLALAGAVFWFACTPAGGPRTLAAVGPATATCKELLYAVTATLVLVTVAFAPQRAGSLARVLGHPWALALGRVSYGVFLWHLLVLAGVLDMLDIRVFTGGFWRVLLVTAVGSVAVATASWRLLESPLLDLAHRSPQRVPMPPAPRP